MFLFQQSTFYAWQIVFIISLSNLTFGTPYFPGIGISVMHSTETNDAQPNWDENDEFDTSYDAINKDISRILEVLQDQLQEKENTLERKAESQRKLRKLKNVRLYRSVVY